LYAAVGIEEDVLLAAIWCGRCMNRMRISKTYMHRTNSPMVVLVFPKYPCPVKPYKWGHCHR
jgi:hypothetical protein